MNKRIRKFTLKACAKVEAATDGDVFVHLVVTFLRHTPRCIIAAKAGALLPIKEIGPDGRNSIGLPLLLTNGGVSSTCIWQRMWVTDWKRQWRDGSIGINVLTVLSGTLYWGSIMPWYVRADLQNRCSFHSSHHCLYVWVMKRAGIQADRSTSVLSFGGSWATLIHSR